ncbi:MULTISPECIES: efflux transporter outer membrane subunit [Sphingobium]|uniref:efflux transporter outer membrane subunit n=1 Tax=Sphingobium TaxID=165695 RepID=UPI0015EBEDBC|nr:MULTISPECIES: efflux transporter outer membrane subunit [Sphingobium]MCW2362970.1 NodT family efflux transporter outer membrane factor (OMF) lipoprotein [Sphingobium sp. B10D3B]MCW2400350.1 NodT family efflux transporter outer membrane factor (OMF) lipoprotein [Sphingobium sp. B10D7B]MCW2407328.1 NodT family efflux transporter outer membrane factor (OMF) lipoprotein [Sphingobium xanthum]
MTVHRIFAPFVSALALSACAVGPDYVAPTPPSASSGPFLSAASPAFAPAPVQPDWWRLYNDPVLDGLVTDALAANTDVRIALARLEKARAGLRGARADRLPRTDLSASGDYGRLPASQRAPGAPREDWALDAGLSVSYEVDLFGRVSRGVEAARGDADAAAADADAVRVAVVADTTRAYADAASGAAQLAVNREIVGLLDRLLDLTGKRREAGLATTLDVSRIAALRDQRAADIPLIEAQRQAALFRLATLTGRTPDALPEIAGQRSIGLEIRQAIPVGDGATLLARRPDVRAAERRLAADTARIGVATADLYPRISLGGSGGSTGNDIGAMFGGGPLRWLLGGLISWSFPNQEAARARIAGARADSDAALAAFDGAVLNALEETETALSTYGHALERRQRLQAARDSAGAAARITRAQQREGAIDSLQLLDTERTFAEAEAALAAQDAEVARAQIDVFRALGGSWAS